MLNRIVKLCLVMALLLSFAMALPTTAQDDGDLGVITIGTNAEYPPFESVDEAGDIIGFDIDIVTAIAADAGFEIEFVNTRWDGIFVALSQGEFDAVISAATITDEREDIIDFTEPYFNAGQTIAVASDMASVIDSPEDLAGLRIGVQLGTTGDEYASEIDGAEVVRFDEITLAFQALGEGDIDAILNDGPTSADIIANNPDLDAVIVGEPLTDEFYGIAVNPERADVLDAINLSLANVIASGEYAEIFNAWFGQDPPEAFMPMMDDMADGGDMMVEIDSTDPASVALGFLQLALTDPMSAVMYMCDAAIEESGMPTEDDIAMLEGLEVDLSGMEMTVEVDGDTALASGTGEITLTLQGQTQTVDAAEFIEDLGGALPLIQVDGEWLACPTDEEE